MAIAHDALSENSATDSVSFTADASWTHTPADTAKGVVVAITQPLSSADEVAGVTYGGVALNRVISQARTVTEQMRVYLYFLGEGIPAGAQTVAVTLTTQTAAAKHGFAFTMTAGAGMNTAADASNGADLGIIANPSITVTHTGTLSGWAGYAAHGYGAAAVVTTGLQTGETYQAGHDPGAAVAMVYTRHGGADAASSTYGYTTLASDDQCLAAVVIKEIPAPLGEVNIRQYWVASLPPLHIADGAALANSTTLTDVSPTPHITLPANLLELGSEIELWAAGQFSNTVTPTLLLGFYYGGVAGLALAATSAITTASGVTAVPWQLYWRGVVRAVGSSGSINGQGYINLGTALTAFTTRPIPEVAANRTVTIDTTVAKTLTVGAQWGTASASNTLTCNDLSVTLVS